MQSDSTLPLIPSGEGLRDDYDVVVYLAKYLPRMTLPRDHEDYAHTHEDVLRYMCNTRCHRYAEDTYGFPPSVGDETLAVIDVKGESLLAEFPFFKEVIAKMWPLDEMQDLIRPKASYAVLFQKCAITEDGEIVG